MKRGVLVVVTSILLAGSARPALADDYLTDFGMGTGAVFANLFYMPTKFAYATLGGITGGFAYILTGLNSEVAQRIWTPALGGDYVVTIRHLRNEERLYFSGTRPAYGDQ